MYFTDQNLYVVNYVIELLERDLIYLVAVVTKKILFCTCCLYMIKIKNMLTLFGFIKDCIGRYYKYKR